jgi:hypothetical protein
VRPTGGSATIDGNLFFRGQGSAIAVSLLWLLIGESILAAAVGHGIRFFPGHVFAAMAAGGVTARATCWERGPARAWPFCTRLSS